MATDFRDPTLQHQIVALYVKGTRLMGYGVNQRRYAHLMSYFYDSLHAEGDLIRRFGEKLRGSKVFLYRYNNAAASPLIGKPLCAKPCLLCGHLLKQAGVRKVVYLNHDGVVESMRREELPTLTEDPSLLTKMFLDRTGANHHGKFFASRHLV